MEEKSTQKNVHGNNFFDSLMFGPPQQPKATNSIEDKGESSNTEDQTSNQKQGDDSGAPQVDMLQMMQSFDALMGYVNKLSPSLKKLGPLVELLKGINGPKK